MHIFVAATVANKISICIMHCRCRGGHPIKKEAGWHTQPVRDHLQNRCRNTIRSFFISLHLSVPTTKSLAQLYLTQVKLQSSHLYPPADMNISRLRLFHIFSLCHLEPPRRILSCSLLRRIESDLARFCGRGETRTLNPCGIRF